MEKIDYEYLCTVIGDLSGVPVRLFSGDKLTFYHAIAPLPKDPMKAFEAEILAVRAHIGYFITPYFHYYGVVNHAERRIVIGPSIQTRCSEQTLRELAFRCNVSADEVGDFIAGMNAIVPMPLDSILQILCALNYLMNGEKLGLSDLRIYDAEQQTLRAALEREQTSREIEGLQDGDRPQDIHNTLALEQTILNFVRRGDTASLKAWISGMPAVRPGILASDQLRQVKNTFVVTATLVSRAAIRGGMAVEDALSLSDAYIQKCELMRDIERITNLQYHMLFDFTGRTEKLRLGRAPSRFVTEVTNYILHHLSEPVTTEKIAKALFLSRSRLSVKFKQETGENLIDFILKEKTEEAKRLLRYSDRSAAAISAYLGFSSQSHFSRVFKKYAGCLPNDYRKRHGS